MMLYELDLKTLSNHLGIYFLEYIINIIYMMLNVDFEMFIRSLLEF